MEKNNYSAKIDNLITLCHIIDDFEEFEKRLLPVISPKYNRDFVFQLWDVSEGKFKLGARKAKKFYSENKAVIDIINLYSNVPTFINLNYRWHGEPNGDLQFFYQYISSRKDEIDKIFALLEKLKELGFNDIDFNSELDFTQETHKIYTLLSDNFNITYLNNLTAIPNYNPGVISYKTNGSGYKITVGVSLGNVREYDKKIVLNDLTFNPNELPSAISKEETFDKIIGLKEKKQKEYSVIKDSVNLGIGISDLYVMFNAVSSRINKLENVEKKAELVELLQTIRDAILKMQAISTEYDQKVAETNPSISETFLDEQKKSYVRRREDAKIHIW